MLPLILKLVNSIQISDVDKYSTGNLVNNLFFIYFNTFLSQLFYFLGVFRFFGYIYCSLE